MYKTILVPLDGSARAEAILSHVQGLAKALSSKVVFLEVLDPTVAAVPPYDFVPVIDADELAKQTAAVDSYLSKFVKAFQEQGIEAIEMTEPGSPVRTILEVAARENADLIAMASHGRTGLARVFYGSVSAGVLQQTDRPLLIVRAENG